MAVQELELRYGLVSAYYSKIAESQNHPYGEDLKKDVAMRVVADPCGRSLSRSRMGSAIEREGGLRDPTNTA